MRNLRPLVGYTLLDKQEEDKEIHENFRSMILDSSVKLMAKGWMIGF